MLLSTEGTKTPHSSSDQSPVTQVHNGSHRPLYTPSLESLALNSFKVPNDTFLVTLTAV